MSPSSLTSLLREKASELGFELVGAIPVSRSKTIDIYNAGSKKAMPVQWLIWNVTQS